MTAASATRRFLLLRALRWFPVGLLIPVLVLLLQERGLSLTEIGLVTGAQGLTVFLLELPTGGLADALGRRPVLLAATALQLVVTVLLAVTTSLPLLLVVFALEGVYRALESGPLDAWFVDALADADAAHRMTQGLSWGGAVTSAAVAAGALLAGVVVAANPLGVVAPLAAPLVLAAAVRLIELGAIALLVTEVRERRGPQALRASVGQIPTVVRAAVGTVTGSSVLLALVGVEALWSVGMTAFETFLPVKLGEVVPGGAEQAGAMLGPAAAAAWVAAAAGAAAAPLLGRRIGLAASGAALKILQGATILAMGLLGGPAGVLTAYLGCYALHGAANPVHQALLHQRVRSAERTTVLSLSSMAGQPAYALAGVLLGAVADRATVSLAIVLGGTALAAAAALYLPAWRDQRAAARSPARVAEDSAASPP